MEQEAAEDDEDGGGPTPLEIAAFIWTAPARRRRLSLASFVAVATLGTAFAIAKPPAYISEVHLLAQRNGTMEKLATQTRTDESPTKSAAEAISKRDNLVAIMDETHLVDRFNTERSAILRAKDRVLSALRGPVKYEDQERAILGSLEKKIYINTDETTITIGVEWSNAKTAYDIVAAAQRRFLDARQASEVGMITDAITILETHLKTERENLDDAVSELQHLQEAKLNGEPSPAAEPTSSASAPSKKRAARPKPVVQASIDPERKKLLADMQAELASTESDRQRKLGDLDAQLAALRSTLGPEHPSVVALERQVDEVSHPSAKTTALKMQIAELEADMIVPTNAGAPPSMPSSNATPGARDAGAPIVLVEHLEDDAATALAKQKLTNATSKCDELQSRIRSAKIDLDVAEAAFKYKYTVITPPEVPREPKRPSPALVGLMAIIAAFATYFLVPAVLDLLSGRLIMSWQARKLGIPVLGEIESPEHFD